jgi:hypothetical protein
VATRLQALRGEQHEVVRSSPIEQGPKLLCDAAQVEPKLPNQQSVVETSGRGECCDLLHFMRSLMTAQEKYLTTP